MLSYSCFLDESKKKLYFLKLRWRLAATYLIKTLLTVPEANYTAVAGESSQLSRDALIIATLQVEELHLFSTVTHLISFYMFEVSQFIIKL